MEGIADAVRIRKEFDDYDPLDLLLLQLASSLFGQCPYYYYDCERDILCVLELAIVDGPIIILLNYYASYHNIAGNFRGRNFHGFRNFVDLGPFCESLISPQKRRVPRRVYISRMCILYYVHYTARTSIVGVSIPISGPW